MTSADADTSSPAAPADADREPAGDPRRPRPTLYEVKRWLMTPRTVYMRLLEPDLDDYARTMFEAHYYRRQMYDFLRATLANRDILVDVDVDESSIVLDVGAFTGQWAEKIDERFAPTIHAFEPADAGIRRMEAAFADRPNITVHPYGLGHENAVVGLSLAGPGSSIHHDRAPWGTAEVVIRDVVEVLDELGLDHIHLLKVNIEGAEFDLLDRLIAADWLPRIDQLLIQFHEWHPNAYYRRWKIRRAFRRDHEEVWGHSWVWEYWRRKPEE